METLPPVDLPSHGSPRGPFLILPRSDSFGVHATSGRVPGAVGCRLDARASSTTGSEANGGRSVTLERVDWKAVPRAGTQACVLDI